ncbi:MAG: alpha/beta fold hydrolase [Gammaproteobacteria bacterium]
MIDIKEHGIIAKLFLPEANEPRPAVIILGGSGGGFDEPIARLFARQGYVALALAYFNADGLPKYLENIPLEYFLNAIRWLKNQLCVKSKQVHLYGISRGGELAILLASIFPEEITSVVAVVPSCVTYGGVPHVKKPAWTLNKKPLPIAPSPEVEDEREQQRTYNSVNLTQLFLEKMKKNAEKFETAMIKVENIKCPLLIVSGKDDRMWPSWLYGEKIMQRLETTHSKIFREHLCYENVGHVILPSSRAPVITEAGKHPVTGLCYEVGGDPVAQAKANQDSWEKIIQFFTRF